jgi:hypothetical protein
MVMVVVAIITTTTMTLRGEGVDGGERLVEGGGFSHDGMKK